MIHWVCVARVQRIHIVCRTFVRVCKTRDYRSYWHEKYIYIHSFRLVFTFVWSIYTHYVYRASSLCFSSRASFVVIHLYGVVLCMHRWWLRFLLCCCFCTILLFFLSFFVCAFNCEFHTVDAKPSLRSITVLETGMTVEATGSVRICIMNSYADTHSTETTRLVHHARIAFFIKWFL